MQLLKPFNSVKTIAILVHKQVSCNSLKNEINDILFVQTNN